MSQLVQSDHFTDWETEVQGRRGLALDHTEDSDRAQTPALSPYEGPCPGHPIELASLLGPVPSSQMLSL